MQRPGERPARKDLAAFESDKRMLDAVSRCFGIIGEAKREITARLMRRARHAS